MKNESIAQVPQDLTEGDNLKRFLLELVEKLDVAFGYKGDPGFLTLQELTELVRANVDKLESLQKTDESSVSALTKADVFTAVPLNEAFRDFNHAVWNTFAGFGTFTALGSELVNPPFSPVAGSTYDIRVESLTVNENKWQRVSFRTGSTLTIYERGSVGGIWAS